MIEQATTTDSSIDGAASGLSAVLERAKLMALCALLTADGVGDSLTRRR